MSAEYSVEKVRAAINGFVGYSHAHHSIGSDLIGIARAYAERIEADERSGERLEPDGGNYYRPHKTMVNSGTFWRCAHGYTSFAERCPHCVDESKPAQPAQLWEMKQRACRAHALCNELRLAHPEIPELGDDGVLHEAIHDILRVDTPTAEPVAQGEALPEDFNLSHKWDGQKWIREDAQPHSPDAADSGRVDAILAHLKDPANVHVMMLRGVIAVPSIRSMVDLRGEVPNGEDVQLARIAELQEQLAARGQGEAVAEVVEQDLATNAYPRAIRHLKAVKAESDLLKPGTKLYTAQPASPAPAAPDDAAALLDALQHNSWDLRCFDHTDGEDIGWRVIEHYQAEPRERVIAEVFEDNPRYAIKQALLAAAPSVPEGGEVGL